MDMQMLFPLIFILITLPLILVVVILAIRSKKKRFSKGVFKDQGFFKTSNRGSSSIDGVQYTYYYHPGSRNSPSYFRIRIPCSSVGSFKLSLENPLDRFFKRFGLSTEIQAGNPEFDERFYITTNDIAWTRMVLNDGSKQRAALRIADSGFNEIHASGKILTATCRPFRIKDQVTKEMIEDTAAQLLEMSKELPPAGSVPSTTADPNWKLKRALIFAVAVGAPLLGGVLMALGIVRYRPMDFGPLFLSTLKYSLPIMVGFLVISILSLRGRASSHKEFLGVLIIVILGFPLCGAGLGVFLNGYLDRSAERYNDTEVIGRTISRSDDSTTYYAVVRSWRRPGSEKIRVSRSDYNRLRPNSSEMTVVTRAGNYGFEWIRAIEIYE